MVGIDMKKTNPENEIFNKYYYEVLPILENAAQDGTIVSYTIKEENEIWGMRGYSAEKSIPTFYYNTKSGGRGSVVIFVKHMTCGKPEAPFFKLLSEMGLPVPKYYGHLMDQHGEEIIFMEYLKEIGVDHTNEFEVQQFVGIVARFNAVNIHELRLENPDRKVSDFDMDQWIENLRKVYENGLSGKIGSYIQNFCKTNPREDVFPDKWVSCVYENIVKMKVGLNHNDPGYQNIGWRKNRKDILFFDLHNVGLAPRFSDISKVMAWLNAAKTSMSNHAIASLYLKEYARWGGQIISLDDFLEEIRWMTIANDLSILPFQLMQSLSGKVDYTDNIEEGKKANQVWLLKGLNSLSHASQQSV